MSLLVKTFKHFNCSICLHREEINLFLVRMFQSKRFVIIACTFSDVSVIPIGCGTSYVHLVVFFCGGGSKVSRRRGRQPWGRGGPTYDFTKMSKKLHEIEKNLGRRGRTPGQSPRYANVMCGIMSERQSCLWVGLPEMTANMDPSLLCPVQ